MGEPREGEARARLRALDQAIARRGASARAREAVRRKIQQSAVEQPFHVRLRWWPAVAFAAGAITMGVLLVSDGAGPKSDSQEVARAREGLEGGAIVEAGGRAEPDAEAEAEAAPGLDVKATTEPACAELRPGLVGLETDECAHGDGVRVTALVPSRLRWDASAVEVSAGELLFDVAPRPERPLHVTLGTIDIEVVGTRFVVHRGDAGGWISMLEGHVRARTGEGAARDLRDGQRLEWPGAAAGPNEAAEPVPARGARPSAVKLPEPDEGLGDLLAEVATLRREGSYREAVERLRASDSRRFSPRARQLVSYEIGTLLERQLGDASQACDHWAEHRRRYPNGRHDAIVARSMERLRCEQATE